MASVSVRVNNCQLDTQIEMIKWAAIIVPIIIVGIVGGILIDKRKKKKNLQTVPEKFDTKEPKTKEDHDWMGI